MKDLEQLKAHYEAALKQIVEEAKRDPKVDPEKLREIARRALELRGDQNAD